MMQVLVGIPVALLLLELRLHFAIIICISDLDKRHINVLQ